MPLGASRISFLAKTSVAVEAEVIRKKISLSAVGNADISTSASKFGGSSAYFDGGTTYIVMNGNDTDGIAFGVGDRAVRDHQINRAVLVRVQRAKGRDVRCKVGGFQFDNQGGLIGQHTITDGVGDRK